MLLISASLSLNPHQHTRVGPHPRASDSTGLGQGPRVRISNKFPGDMAAAGLRSAHSEEFVQNHAVQFDNH